MKYAVIGAGLSGLAAARRIQDAGHEVVVIETADEPGGRCRTIERDGFVIDTGPEIAATSYRNWLALADEAGLAADIVDSPTVTSIICDGKLIEIDTGRFAAMLTAPLLGWRGKINLATGGLRLRRHIKAVPPLLLDAASLDDTSRTALDVALGHFGPEVTNRLLDPMLRPIAGTRLDQVSTFMVPYALSEWTRMINLRGGLQRLPRAIAATLDVRYGTRVEKINSGHGHVDIEVSCGGENQTIMADKCLIAAQYDDAERIFPRLREISGDYSRTMQFLQMMDVKLAYAKRPVSSSGSILCPFAETKDICFVSLTHNKAPDRAPAGCSLFSVSTEHLEFGRFDAMADEEIVEVARNLVERLFPDVAGSLLFSLVGRYPRVSNLPSPGFFHRTRALWDAVGAEPRVHLGGDLFNSGAGMEGAVMSGLMAADRLLAR